MSAASILALTPVSWSCALCSSTSAPSFTRKSTLKEHLKRKHELDDEEAEMIIQSSTDTQPQSAATVKQEQKPQRHTRPMPASSATLSSAAPAAPASPALSTAASASTSSPPLASAHVPTMSPSATVAASPLPVVAAASVSVTEPVGPAASIAASLPPPPPQSAAVSSLVKQESVASPPSQAPLSVDVAATSADTPMASAPLTPLHAASAPAAASVSPNRMSAKAAAMKRRTPASQRRQAVARAPLSDQDEEDQQNADAQEEPDQDTTMEAATADSPTKQEPQQQQPQPIRAPASVASVQPLSYDPMMPPPPPSPARRFAPTHVMTTASSSSGIVRPPTTPGASPPPASSAAAPYSSVSGLNPAVTEALAAQPPQLGSCHHCKNIRNLSDTVQCSSRLPRRSDVNGRRLPICTKRWCWACLQKCYPVSFAIVHASPDAWNCPACEDVCFCIKCKTRLASLGRVPGDPTVPQPPKVRPPSPVPAPAPAPAPIQRKESTRDTGAASGRNTAGRPKSHAPSQAPAAAPASHVAPSTQQQPQQQQQQQQQQPQQQPQQCGSLCMHPPIQLVLAAGTEVSRVSPPTECHALVVQLCEPHTLSVVVRLSPELAKQQSVYPECSVHFPLPGCPLWLPPGAHYRLCNLALDDPVWTAAPAGKPADASAALPSGESSSTASSSLVQSLSPGSVAVVEIWVQSSAPSSAETAATRAMVSDRLASLQAQAHKLRAHTAQQQADPRADSASESSDASDDDDDEYGTAPSRKRKRVGSRPAAASKHARAAAPVSSGELRMLDTQIADLQAYLEGYGPAAHTQES